MLRDCHSNTVVYNIYTEQKNLMLYPENPFSMCYISVHIRQPINFWLSPQICGQFTL